MIADETRGIASTYDAKVCCDQLIVKLENGAPLTVAEEEHVHAIYRLEKSVSHALEISRRRGILTSRIVI